jgi:hypothetical protein
MVPRISCHFDAQAYGHVTSTKDILYQWNAKYAPKHSRTELLNVQQCIEHVPKPSCDLLVPEKLSDLNDD